MMKQSLSLLFVLFIFMVSSAVGQVTTKGLSMQLIKNYSYNIITNNNRVTLVNGESKYTRIVKVAFGDLNNDGLGDAAVILASDIIGSASGGGVELTVVANVNGTPVQVASVSLGEPAVKAIKIVNRIIIINMLIHGHNDPHCCPTLRKTVRYRLQANKLVSI